MGEYSPNGNSIAEPLQVYGPYSETSPVYIFIIISLFLFICSICLQEKVVPCLLRLRQARDARLQAAVRQALALVGYTDPVKGRGIRVLSIDGGGTRYVLPPLLVFRIRLQV